MNMKNFDFVGKRKLFAYIALGIMAVGLIVNVIFGVELDVSFKGGTFITYSYTGEIDIDEFKNFANDTLDVKFDVTTGQSGDADTIQLSLADNLSLEEMTKLKEAAEKKYADNKLEELDTQSPDATTSRLFFIKCLVAVVLAMAFLLLYIALRFRNIGGWSAGLMAVLALLNDLIIAYFTFVIFQITLDDNFVAVLLTILGYSLNATLVIFDRVRENRRLMPNASLTEIVNTSIQQSYSRTFNTSLCTFAAIAVVVIVALIMHVDSIISFALPMMVGIISGFFSSIFIAGPWWVALSDLLDGKRAARAAKNAGKPSKVSNKKKKKRKTTRL